MAHKVSIVITTTTAVVVVVVDSVDHFFLSSEWAPLVNEKKIWRYAEFLVDDFFFLQRRVILFVLFLD